MDFAFAELIDVVVQRATDVIIKLKLTPHVEKRIES